MIDDGCECGNMRGGLCDAQQLLAAFDTRVLRLVVVCAILIGLGTIPLGCAAGGPTERGYGAGAKHGGAPWTIRCLELAGDQGRVTVQRLAEALRQTPGVRADEVFVQEGAGEVSRLYYGTYYRSLDPKTGRRSDPPLMRSDLDLVRTLGFEGGRRLFAAALPVRMPQPDVGNPAWDLRNVRAQYSLQVAVFEPTEAFFEYKQAAADFCKLLRERGYEAYYYHAPASSSVTVGAFGADVVRRRAVLRDGRTVYENEYSSEVQRLQQEELLRHNLLNGAIYRVRNETGLSEPVPSRLVEVPRGGAHTDTSSGDANTRTLLFPRNGQR